MERSVRGAMADDRLYVVIGRWESLGTGRWAARRSSCGVHGTWRPAGWKQTLMLREGRWIRENWPGPGQARPRAAGGFQGRRSGATSAFSNAGQLAAARGGRWT